MKIIIKIPYTKGNIKWYTRRYHRHLPESWADITDLTKRVQYFKMLWMDGETALVEILKDIIQIPKVSFLSIHDHDMTLLLDQLAWMRDDLGVEPLIPQFSHDDTVYHFPKPDFDNGIAREYALADEYYSLFAKDEEDTDSLLLLTAAIVRLNPSVPNQSREIVENRLESFKTLPFEIILVALRYFEALKKEVYDLGLSLQLFDSLPDENEEDTDIIQFGWWTAYRYIAKSHVFGDFNGVCNSLFWDVFKYLIEEKQREIIAKRAQKDNTQS